MRPTGYSLTPIEARRWFWRPSVELDGKTPSELSGQLSARTKGRRAASTSVLNTFPVSSPIEARMVHRVVA